MVLSSATRPTIKIVILRRWPIYKSYFNTRGSSPNKNTYFKSFKISTRSKQTMSTVHTECSSVPLARGSEGKQSVIVVYKWHNTCSTLKIASSLAKDTTSEHLLHFFFCMHFICFSSLNNYHKWLIAYTMLVLLYTFVLWVRIKL